MTENTKKNTIKSIIIKNPEKAATLIKVRGVYSFGNGVYLNVTKNLKKSWIGKIQKIELKKNFGLGSFPKVSHKEALEKFIENTKNLELGVEVVSVKKAKLKIPKFENFALEFFEAKKDGYVNYKHRQQWVHTLQTYAFPFIGEMVVSEIIEEDVINLLKPIWLQKHETARRVLQRIARVLNSAKVRQLRKYDINTKGIIDELPKYNGRVQHFRSVPYTDIAKVYKLLGEQNLKLSILAIQAIILTCVRSGELRGARWEEIDFKAKQWVIPARRMKMKIEHCVPLSDEAINIFKKAKELAGAFESEYIFFGMNSRKPITDAALGKMLDKLSINGTIHGFRSTFRTWADEVTDFDSDLAEMALAHTRKNKVESAYRRGTRFEKRLEIMDKWAKYIIGNNNKMSSHSH